MHVEGIAPKLVSLLATGALEAIETVAVITTDNADACDQIRDSDAIVLLAGFINTSESDGGMPPPGLDTGEPMDVGPTPSEHAARWGLGLDLSSIAARPTIVPVASKSKAVAALWNVAMSSDANLEYITSQKQVIPQLVQLMCKMNEHGDDGELSSELSAELSSARARATRATRTCSGERSPRSSRAAIACNRPPLPYSHRPLLAFPYVAPP